MKKLFTFMAVISLVIMFIPSLQAQETSSPPPGFRVDTRIDNMGYWQQCAAWGLVPVQPFIQVPPAEYTGTKVLIDGLLIDDSPDVPVTEESAHQSENSIVINPNDKNHALNSNNSGNWPNTSSFYGADRLDTYDAGETWGGSTLGPNGMNYGDPVAAINMTGRYFIGYITTSMGQGVSFSDDYGVTWTSSVVSTSSTDKNHLWVDNSPTSSYNGNIYNGWMEGNQIRVTRSLTNGSTWEPKLTISSGTSAGSHNQGINFKTGPNGEVYAAWSVYDAWPADEKAIGFAKSLDGGASWETATRILDNIKGVRTTGVPQNQRVNSFPSMACDISNSPYRGNIYIVWPNIGYPGVNSGTDRDIYIIRSSDQGATWSAPVKVNQDPSGAGKTHYMSWIACDQANGQLAVVFYDNRNTSNNQCEAWMAWSQDAGDTWEEMKVSDVSWTPSPIPGMASGYFGDYLGIDIYNGIAYPCWTDNRIGYAMTYVSPISLHIPASQVIYQADYINGNGQMDYGENILMGMEMLNNGELEAEDVTVTLSTESPYITFEDSTEFYGNFNIGESKTIMDAFQFNVSEFIPDGYMVTFKVTAVNSVDTTTISYFDVEAHAPAVTILSMTINDAAGNNNGILDPGESAIISFLTENTGEFDALDVVSTLESSNPFVALLDNSIDLGTLTPGESVNASFPVEVSSDCPYGSATVFHNVATWEFGQDEMYKTTRIGLYVEDWETGDFTKFPWEFTGNTPWVIDPDVKWEGNYSAHSGEVTDNEMSGLTINYNVLVDDTICFHRKVSSEIFADKLLFYVDDLLLGTWTGESDWQYFVYPVLAGPHTFTWKYEKNGMVSQGADRGWVDYIIFPPEYQTAASAGGDAVVCAGDSYQLMSAAIGYDSVRWTTGGSGVFSDPTIYNPLYTPSADDITAGSVVLTITAYGPEDVTISDEMTLTIESPPQAYAGGDVSGCASGYLIDNATASDYLELTWTTGGDGTFSDIHELHPTYLPGEADITAGSATLHLMATSMGVCDAAQDSMMLTIHLNPVVILGPDTSICAHLTYTLDATTAGAASYLWSPGGETTPTITVDSAGVGIGSQAYTVTVTSDEGCEGSDEATVTFKDCTGINELAEHLTAAVFPNPNTGSFTVRLNARTAEQVNLRMISAAGETVYEQRDIVVNGEVKIPVNARHLPQGSYIVEIANGKGNLFTKIVISK